MLKKKKLDDSQGVISELKRYSNQEWGIGLGIDIWLSLIVLKSRNKLHIYGQ